MNNITKEYEDWLNDLKSKVRSVQLKTSVAVNSAVVGFYWELGKMIPEKTEQSNWGDKILEQVSKDLKYEFPNIKGLSRTNLAYAKQFFKFYQSSIVQQAVGQLQISSDLNNKITQHPVMQIPWGHNIFI